MTESPGASKSGLVASFKKLFAKEKGRDGGRRGSWLAVGSASGELGENSAENSVTVRTPRPNTSLNLDLEPSSCSGSSPAVETPTSPFTNHRGLSGRTVVAERQLQGSCSSQLAAVRPVSVAQVCLYHSISDPCDSPPQPLLSRSGPQDVLPANRAHLPPQTAWTTNVRCPSAQLSSSQISISSLSVTSARGPGARSDAALPYLTDGPRPGEDAHGAVALSAPGESSKRRMLSDVSLPCVDPVRGARSPGAPSPSPSLSQHHLSVPATPTETAAAAKAQATGDHSPAPAPSTPSGNTMLLAMCPGIPAAMRRRTWCLEDFEVQKRLYKGSTSAVYKAICRRSGLPVALKIYFLSRVPANVVHMIVREIKIHVELVHKNVVMLYGAFQDERRLVLVQEYAARGDLYGIHRAMNRRMTEEQLTELVLTPFLEALSYLHARGVCHRDIKPENILFTQDWRLVIADYGVSINLNQERAVTRAGTLEYMAPEVERCPLKMLPEENKEKDDLAYTTAVDVWATGVLAYELLVGFPPFVADNGGAAASQQQGAGAAFLAEHATRKTLSFPSSTSANARDFITAALAERPEERPTALQLLRHTWLATPPPQAASRRQSSMSGAVLVPSRLGSSSIVSQPSVLSVPTTSPPTSVLAR